MLLKDEHQPKALEEEAPQTREKHSGNLETSSSNEGGVNKIFLR